MFPVIVIIPSSNTINLFLYVLLSLLILFMPAKTTPPYSKNSPTTTFALVTSDVECLCSVYFIEFKCAQLPEYFPGICQIMNLFWFAWGGQWWVVWHCVTLDSDTVQRTGTSIVTRWRSERYIPSRAQRPILVVAWKLNFVCKIDKYSKPCLLWT